MYYFYFILSRLSARNFTNFTNRSESLYIIGRFDLWSSSLTFVHLCDDSGKSKQTSLSSHCSIGPHLGHSSELDGSQFVVGCADLRDLRPQGAHYLITTLS